MITIILDSIKAVILGVVEGFTEFLPISSTGHLILVNQWVSFSKDFTILFDIVIQLGAILAVLVYFFKKITTTPDIWKKTIIGVLPAIILGGLFGGLIEEKLFNPWTVATALLIGGLIILYIEAREKRTTNAPTRIMSLKDMRLKTAFFIGLVQCLSMIPGTSRAGATIIGAMIFGASRVVATEFSFFLAIPTMLAASTYSLLKYKGALNFEQISVLSVGFVVSFIVALAVIKFLINYIQRNNFKVFGWYRIILGIIILAFFLFR